MFNKKECFCALIILFFIPLNYGCKVYDKIETVAIVTSRNFETDIIIFFEQDTSIGTIKKRNGKYFFYADKKPSVFFVKEKLGLGYLENYVVENNCLKKINYTSDVDLGIVDNQSYQVVGGKYVSILIDDYKNGTKYLNFLIYKAGKAADIKASFKITDSEIIKYYRLKN